MAGISPLTVGLVHNWPGAKNSELDIIIRVQSILENLGHRTQIVDPLGHPLNQCGDKTAVDSETSLVFDLVLNFHYLNPAFLTGLSYVVNWNPLAYIVDSPITKKPLPAKQLSYLVDCLRSHDRVLSAGSVLVDDYTVAARVNLSRPWLSEAQLSLHTSIESEGALPLRESLDPAKLKVFYIGVNWEKLSQDKDRQVRHDGLFETLDQSGQFEFYGLREQYGIRLWQGIDSYKGELPFDGGISITEKAHECGATLVLSSDQHRASGLVSTRIFQACKAGAIIIADRNVFIEHHFADAVLYFDYGNTPKKTAQNILQQVNWIKQNWRQAKEKAILAQCIFIKKFAFEKELSLICQQAVLDRQSKQDCLIELGSNKVVIVYYALVFDEVSFLQCLDNIKRQTHMNIELSVCGVFSVCKQHETFFNELDCCVKTSFFYSYQHQSLGCWIAGDQLAKGSFCLLYTTGFIWHAEHIFRLLCECVHNNKLVACSPLFVWHEQLEHSPETMEPFMKGLDGRMNALSPDKLVDFEWQHFPLGNILFSCSLFDIEEELALLIHQFNLAALFVLLLLKVDDLTDKIGNVSFISSRYTACEKSELDMSNIFFEFDEYRAFGEDSHIYRQRDRNALCSLLRYVNKGVSVKKLDEKFILWGLEQIKGVDSRTVKNMQAEQFTQRASFKKHIKHIISSYPILLKIASVFARAFRRIARA